MHRSIEVLLTPFELTLVIDPYIVGKFPPSVSVQVAVEVGVGVGVAAGVAVEVVLDATLTVRGALKLEVVAPAACALLDCTMTDPYW